MPTVYVKNHHVPNLYPDDPITVNFTGNTVVIYTSDNGPVLDDGYKYISPHDGHAIVPWGTGIETSFSPEEQLYDLNSDPGESVNIVSEFTELVTEMRRF